MRLCLDNAWHSQEEFTVSFYVVLLPPTLSAARAPPPCTCSRAAAVMVTALPEKLCSQVTHGCWTALNPHPLWFTSAIAAASRLLLGSFMAGKGRKAGGGGGGCDLQARQPAHLQPQPQSQNQTGRGAGRAANGPGAGRGMQAAGRCSAAPLLPPQSPPAIVDGSGWAASALPAATHPAPAPPSSFLQMRPGV